MRKSSRNSAASNDTKHLWVNPQYEASGSAIYPYLAVRSSSGNGPHLKGSRRPRKKVPLLLRRPKVVFFGAQAEKKRFFFFSAPSRYGVRRPNNFFDPPPKKFGPHNFFSAPDFFFRRLFCFFGAQNQKSAFSAGVKGAIFFGAQAEKPRLFFFFRRRFVMVFGGQITFSTPRKYFSAAFFF